MRGKERSGFSAMGIIFLVGCSCRKNEEACGDTLVLSMRSLRSLFNSTFSTKHGRGWHFERTMALKMAQDMKRLTSGSAAMTHYKGVRWRPERKHPWVAELKLPQKKKIWVGNFDTQEEAARAYDKAALTIGKQTRLNFDDSSKLVLKELLESNKCVQPDTTNDPMISYSPFNNIDLLGIPNCQARPMLTHPSSSRVLNMIEFVVSNANVLEGSSILELEPAPLEKGTYICDKSFESMDVGMKSLHMFADDLPLMVEHVLTNAKDASRQRCL